MTCWRAAWPRAWSGSAAEPHRRGRDRQANPAPRKLGVPRWDPMAPGWDLRPKFKTKGAQGGKNFRGMESRLQPDLPIPASCASELRWRRVGDKAPTFSGMPMPAWSVADVRLENPWRPCVSARRRFVHVEASQFRTGGIRDSIPPGFLRELRGSTCVFLRSPGAPLRVGKEKAGPRHCGTARKRTPSEAQASSSATRDFSSFSSFSVATILERLNSSTGTFGMMPQPLPQLRMGKE